VVSFLDRSSIITDCGLKPLSRSRISAFFAEFVKFAADPHASLVASQRVEIWQTIATRGGGEIAIAKA
jgi:hypothetical protein